MSKKIIVRCLSWWYHLIFQRLPEVFPANTAKGIMDPFFVYMEKILVKFPFLFYQYITVYEDMITQESHLVSLTDKDSILVVGCGSLPATCLLLAKQTKATITGIDYDASAIKYATGINKQLRYEKTIKFIHADGLTYSPTKYSVIFLLYGIKVHKEILRIYADILTEKTRIIYRTIEHLEEHDPQWYQELHQLYTIQGCYTTSSFGSIASYLLVPKKNKNDNK